MSSTNGIGTIPIAVVIPCYNVARSIAGVVEKIGVDVAWIICVDDCSRDETLKVLGEIKASNPKVIVLSNEVNLGVGGAMVTGYRKALETGAQIVVKIDGDGQMNPRLVPSLVQPIVQGEADYTKGNRFYRLEGLQAMPTLRLFGNAVLTFLAKFSTGYYMIFDPTNGFTAIHRRALALLQLDKIHKRYFFESDMLFRLNIERAVVMEMPMSASYGDEKSNLSIPNTIMTFPLLHARNGAKRIFYNYFLRNFTVASINLLLGTILLFSGMIFGCVKWYQSIISGSVATAGTVMLAALPVIIGLQLVINFLNFDMASIPDVPLQKCMEDGLNALAAED